MFYTEEITLSTLICDEDDKLTPWGLARLFQDVAGDHSDMLGVGFEGLKPQNKAWILTHVYYNILRLPTAGERLTLKTWAKPDNGLIAPRDYQLIDAEGNICATSASQWVILDMISRRVCRLNQFIKVFKEEDVHTTKYTKLEKIKMPDGMADYKHIEVPYSAIDHTRHVNNAEYIKWICDSLPQLCGSRIIVDNQGISENKQRHEIHELEINYLKETKYGDQNVILRKSEFQSSQNPDDEILNHSDDEIYFQILNTNGISVNAKLTLK